MRKYKIYLFILGGFLILSLLLFLTGIMTFEMTTNAIKEDFNKSSNETTKEKLKCEKLKDKRIICLAESSLIINSGEIVNLNITSKK